MWISGHSQGRFYYDFSQSCKTLKKCSDTIKPPDIKNNTAKTTFIYLLSKVISKARKPA